MNVLSSALFLIPILCFSCNNEPFSYCDYHPGIFVIDDNNLVTNYRSEDGTINYEIVKESDHVHIIRDLNSSLMLTREYDALGRLIKEIFPTGHSIDIQYDQQNISKVLISNLGGFQYDYLNDQLIAVHRLDDRNNIIYTHKYEYPENGFVEHLIKGLGCISYEYNKENKTFHITTPNEKICYQFDAEHRVISKKTANDFTEYNYDIDGSLIPINSASIVDSEFDEHGNLIDIESPDNSIHFEYDALNRLTNVTNDTCSTSICYDLFGRRLFKSNKKNNTVEKEYFLYLGEHEIAILDSEGLVKSLRIPGATFHPNITRAIGIETDNKLFAPIYDLNMNLLQLFDTDSNDHVNFTTSPFGENLRSQSQITPWIYSTKYYDRELNLVYFGHRYYDPSRQKWLTTDPLGPLQSSDLYRYCFDKPLKHIDPDGKFVIAIPLVWSGAALLESLTIAVGTYCIYKGTEETIAMIENMQRSKKGSIDPNLPTNPFDHPDWSNISHPNMAKKGHYKFKNKKNGDEVRLDIGDRNKKNGHRAHDHYHRIKYDKYGREIYLDHNKKPVLPGSEESHLYPPSWVWWNVKA